jgi:homoserine dehydrogenase
LEEYYDNDLLQSVSGILNGSSNYILSKIFNRNESYSDSLKKAQELGFAESNPYFDVEGFDSLYKLIIITLHGFGVLVNPEQVFVYGISNISEHDINYAKEKGFKIKLVGQVRSLEGNRITLFVCPRLVTPDKYIYNVEDQFNGVVLQGLFYDKQFMFGQGAGGHPTGSAVLSDITAQFHDYKYEYKKLNQPTKPVFTDEVAVEVYFRYDSEETLNLLGFESISQRYTSETYRYVIGRTKLSTLVAVANVLRTKDVFLAYTGSAV